MTFKKIVGFGDSWMFGDELIDPALPAIIPEVAAHYSQNKEYKDSHSFLGLLGQHYNVPTVNLGIPGGSLGSTMWMFQWWLESELERPGDCLILIGLTNHSRFSYYDQSKEASEKFIDRFVHSAWAEYPTDFKQMIKHQIALTSCANLDRLNYQQAVLFFDGVAARNNLKLLQFNIPGEYPEFRTKTPTLIMPDRSLSVFINQNHMNNNSGLLKPDGHPNELGHVLIKDLLIPYIDSCTM